MPPVPRGRLKVAADRRTTGSQTAKFGPDILTADHLRNCRGREYQCSCGYDDAKDDEITRLRQALSDILGRQDVLSCHTLAMEALRNGRG
jgi:hypothetical protein